MVTVLACLREVNDVINKTRYIVNYGVLLYY